MSRRFRDKKVAEALAGKEGFEMEKEILENPTEEDVRNFLDLIEQEIQERLEKQVEDFGYIIYSAQQIEELRNELKAQPVYRMVYKVPGGDLPTDREVDSIVEETLFGGVSDREFLKRLNEFMTNSPLTKKGVAQMMGFSETHFGEVLRGNRNVTKNFRQRVVKVLAKYGFN